MNAPFKTCPKCQFAWVSRASLLHDPTVELSGYQPYFEELTAGFFLFCHHACGTSLAVEIDKFADLYKGPIFKQRLTNTAECPEYCQHPENLKNCHLKCECQWVREVLQIIKEQCNRP